MGTLASKVKAPRGHEQIIFLDVCALFFQNSLASCNCECWPAKVAKPISAAKANGDTIVSTYDITSYTSLFPG